MIRERDRCESYKNSSTSPYSTIDTQIGNRSYNLIQHDFNDKSTIGKSKTDGEIEIKNN